MLYNFLKILHILSATCVILIASYTFLHWKQGLTETTKEKIQFITGCGLIPLLFLQLLSGFTLISLEHDRLHNHWISVILIAFVTALISWFSFLFVTLNGKKLFFQKLFFHVALISVLILIFCMANKL